MVLIIIPIHLKNAVFLYSYNTCTKTRNKIALDNETENLLLERLVKLAGKKTLVLITHSNFVTRFCTGVIRI